MRMRVRVMLASTGRWLATLCREAAGNVERAEHVPESDRPSAWLTPDIANSLLAQLENSSHAATNESAPAVQLQLRTAMYQAVQAEHLAKAARQHEVALIRLSASLVITTLILALATIALAVVTGVAG
ncbi:MAG TPA: hypothetical protein VN738_03610 [Acidothermaceae bacterium]|nr:hypothetical protein [Acidothermaceae bacterium]